MSLDGVNWAPDRQVLQMLDEEEKARQIQNPDENSIDPEKLKKIIEKSILSFASQFSTLETKIENKTEISGEELEPPLLNE